MKQFITHLCPLTRLCSTQFLAVAFAGSFASLINIAVVAIIAGSLTSESATRPFSKEAALFTAAVVVFFVLQRFNMRRTIAMTEQVGETLRHTILETMSYSPTIVDERLSHNEKRSLISRDVSAVASAVRSLLALPAQASAAVGALLYLFYLSLTVGMLSLSVTALTAVVVELSKKRSVKLLKAAHAESERHFTFSDDLFQGHKELKLDPPWAEEFLRDDLYASNTRAALLTKDAKILQGDFTLIGIVLSFLLLGSLAFYLRPFIDLSASELTSAFTVLIFFQGAMANFVQTVSGMHIAAISLQRIVEFLAISTSEDERALPPAEPASAEGWQAIHLRGVSFRYPSDYGQDQFQLKNIDLSIKRGSTVFIVGENGSGKTTLAKILLGLYQPMQGEIFLDRTVVAPNNLLSYRSLFSAVFSEGHLFRRNTQGLFRKSEAIIRRSLERMKIELNVSADGRIDIKPYSQGQKKRLASAFTLCSNHSVYLFDEWTADQDPDFRHYFYYEFLPQMKAAGKTLLVITHDDRHFGLADLVVKLAGGKIESEHGALAAASI
jgi:putative ATP-binding cassette transporter